MTTRPGGSSTHPNGATDRRVSGDKPVNPNPIAPNAPNYQQSHPNYYKPSRPIVEHYPAYRPEPKPSWYRDTRKPPKPKPIFHAGYHMFGYTITVLPDGYITKYYNNVPYYYRSGVFYRHHDVSGFIICRPPVGFILRFDRTTRMSAPVLPRIIIDRTLDTRTRVAEAAGIAQYFESLYPAYRRPDDSFYMNNVMAQNYEIYYGLDGIYYTIANGVYTVVNPPLGALTDRLPYDYEEFWIWDRPFYKVDNIIYTIVAPEGVPYYEVVSLL